MSAYTEIAERLRSAESVRIVGGGTRLGWGRPVTAAEELRLDGLNRILEHNPGDLTAVLQAGVPLHEAQAQFAAHGQMLALDPPARKGSDPFLASTVGGVVATRDSGPLRHRYGTARDLVIGIAVALPDGTVARAGGRVIKNVAGYDLAKLMCGAFGTLGVIVEVTVRLHPLPPRTATAVFRHDDPERLADAYLDAFRRPLELDCLDVRWAGGEGAVVARFGGAAAAERATHLGWAVADDEDAIWEAQRAGQRSRDGVARVKALPTDTAQILTLARDTGARAVGRAGSFWLTPPGDVVALRARFRCELRDGPNGADPWGIPEGPELQLMRRVRERFDPRGILNPGIGPA